MTTSPDLKETLRDFFSSHLLEQRQLSPHTLKSYRDTFKLLVEFIRKEKGAVKIIRVDDLDVPEILSFLKSLEDVESGRGNQASTRNCRLAAIRSFFRYIAWQHPSLERLAKRIRTIPIKRAPTIKLDFLTRHELQILFSTVDCREPEGYRDLTLLTFLYNTGARSQEVADTRISWLDLPSKLVTLTGKGRKSRVVPLWEATVKALQTYLDKYRRGPKRPGQEFLFINQRGMPLTRFGVRRIAQKYIERARARCSSLKSKKLSTHSFRHTTAVHLLESGVEVNVIKAWLGHADLSSTSRYLDADLSHKKAALDRFGPPINVTSALRPEPEGSADHILEWLKEL